MITSDKITLIILLLEKLKQPHMEVEYSSCDLSGFPGPDDVCTCGADEINAEIDMLITELETEKEKSRVELFGWVLKT